MKNLLTKENTVVDSEKIRNDFPILTRRINNKPLIYFDNAATTQKPLNLGEGSALFDYTPTP